MFAIFVISLMSLFLIPFTIYKLCNLASGEAAKPWETVSSQEIDFASPIVSFESSDIFSGTVY